MCAHKNRRGIAERVGHPFGIAGVKKEVKPYSYGIRCGTIKKSAQAGIDQKVGGTIVIPSQKRLTIPAKNSMLSIL